MREKTEVRMNSNLAKLLVKAQELLCEIPPHQAQDQKDGVSFVVLGHGDGSLVSVQSLSGFLREEIISLLGGSGSNLVIGFAQNNRSAAWMRIDGYYWLSDSRNLDEITLVYQKILELFQSAGDPIVDPQLLLRQENSVEPNGNVTDKGTLHCMLSFTSLELLPPEVDCSRLLMKARSSDFMKISFVR